VDAVERAPGCRAVGLVEHVVADLDHLIGAHAEHERVEGAVVDRAPWVIPLGTTGSQPSASSLVVSLRWR
jgi:hypothetical protein